MAHNNPEVPPASDVQRWRLIDTAPKDGTFILAFSPSAPVYDPSIAVVSWLDYSIYEYQSADDGLSFRVEQRWPGYWRGAPSAPFRATHWMPLPAPPGAEEVPSDLLDDAEIREFCRRAYEDAGGVTPALREAYQWYLQHKASIDGKT